MRGKHSRVALRALNNKVCLWQATHLITHVLRSQILQLGPGQLFAPLAASARHQCRSGGTYAGVDPAGPLDADEPPAPVHGCFSRQGDASRKLTITQALGGFAGNSGARDPTETLRCRATAGETYLVRFLAQFHAPAPGRRRADSPAHSCARRFVPSLRPPVSRQANTPTQRSNYLSECVLSRREDDCICIDEEHKADES